jgi:hypothetical protein
MDYCGDLVEGGFDDWRVPTIGELAWVVTSGFDVPGGLSVSTKLAALTDTRLIVGGSNSGGWTQFSPDGVFRDAPMSSNQVYEIRCVRSSRVCEPLKRVLAVSSESQLVTNQGRPLMDYCGDLVEGGFDDWRVPTIGELSWVVTSGFDVPGGLSGSTKLAALSNPLLGIGGTDDGWTYFSPAGTFHNATMSSVQVYEIRCVR